MNRAALEAAVARADALATLPSVQGRLVAVLADPNCSFKAVGDLIGADAVLTAHLVRQACVPRRDPTKVVTVTWALRTVGLAAVGSLVRKTRLLQDPAPGTSPVTPRDLWLHSLGVAVATRAIARQIGYAEPDQWYLAGLLHDIGKLAMQQLFPDRFGQTVTQAARARTTFYRAEVDANAASHAQLGRLLAMQWSFPLPLVEAISWHHTPQHEADYPKIVAAVHVADILARALGLGAGGDPFVPPLDVLALARLGLQASQVQDVLTQVEREFTAAVPLLSS